MGTPARKSEAGRIERIVCSNSRVKSNLSLNWGPKARSLSKSNHVMMLAVKSTARCAKRQTKPLSDAGSFAMFQEQDMNECVRRAHSQRCQRGRNNGEDSEEAEGRKRKEEPSE